MNLEVLNREIKDFNQETHGSTDYDKDEIYVMGESPNEFAPLKYLVKKIEGISTPRDLLKLGLVHDTYELFEYEHFPQWFEAQFSRKLTRTFSKKISILHLPNNKEIFDSIELVNKCYQTLKAEQILMNGKNLPVQLGEWYAKAIFGLEQRKSASQRGFDFYLEDKRIEVKVHWADISSPKGVKMRKSLVDLSDHCILIYIARNFMIREICFLDSNFIIRKFGGKGHTIFLKDSDVSQYFFSKSDKHYAKVVNKTALMKYSNPQLAMKLAESFSG
ncbi:MAG: hypothetical protein CME70_09235 [Halobacteriovorax sp.]|nr:hypothetical protein [Halobacteriovorax sp.]|tara:strand:- start:29 stop:853 length:825 start_codon:yes stop_codon:yes gene_type:complete